MLKNQLQPLFKIIILGVLIYSIDKSLFLILEKDMHYQKFLFEIEIIHFFFFLSALLICLTLKKVKQKNIDYVGYIFILLTTLKLAFCYLLFSSILRLDTIGLGSEKFHFLSLFAIYLIIETSITIKILNEKKL